MKLVDDAPGVPARVGRIVPGAVIHHAPGEELRSRIVRKVVVVEKVARGKPSSCDRVADHGAIARQLILIALDVLFFLAETKIVRNVEARQIWLGRGGGDTRQFAVGSIGDAIDIAEPFSTGDFRIEVKLRA